jgi:hypothetical protein
MQPVGDNFDFQSYRTILGVVVLPTVFFVPRGPALEYVADGLHAAVSAAELEKWLNKTEAHQI